MTFEQALRKLWPNGDQKIPGLVQGMIDTAPAVFRKYGINSPLLIAHVLAQISLGRAGEPREIGTVAAL